MRWLVIFAALFLLFGCGEDTLTAPDPSPSPSPSPTPAPLGQDDCDILALAMNAQVNGKAAGAGWRFEETARVTARPIYFGQSREDFDPAVECPQNIGPYNWALVPRDVCHEFGDTRSASIAVSCARPTVLYVEAKVAQRIGSVGEAVGQATYNVVP